MNHIYILNPEGNNGNGTITRYVGRGPGILARIELIDILISASRDAQRIYEEAKAEGAEFADISTPAHVGGEAKRQLQEQAIYN